MRIKIRVRPNSKEQKIIKENDTYIINLKSEAKQGKANLELMKLLKRHFNAKEIKIKSGLISRKKVVEID